eukprot:13313061-Alexandrium_andersonii.AAC.1
MPAISGYPLPEPPTAYAVWRIACESACAYGVRRSSLGVFPRWIQEHAMSEHHDAAVSTRPEYVRQLCLTRRRAS